MTEGATSSRASSDISILLVDDNPTNLQLLVQTLEPLGHKLLVAKSGELALKIASKANPSLVLLDIMMPGIDGYEVCKQLKENPLTQQAEIVFLSALDEVKDKVRGFQLGAVDFITKPFQTEEVLIRVKTHLTIQLLKQDIQSQNSRLKRELRVAQELVAEASQRSEGPLLGESSAVQLLRTQIEKLTDASQSILMSGPPGAGYESIARAIHQQSERQNNAFFYINCATLHTTSPVTLFPDPNAPQDNRERSKFYLADGGTIFLDRIHELSTEQQQALLAFLQRAEGERAADIKPSPDIRIISYTSKDLHHLAQEGKFVIGLVPYLSQKRLHVPSLFERKQDLPTLCTFYLRQQAQRLGKIVDRISEASLQRMAAYSWPGNIDELKNLIERQVAITQDSILNIDETHLEEGLTIGGYRLLERLGKGGMGEVWRAKHQLLARPAAVKLIRTENEADPKKKETLLKRFQREARVTSHLSSPYTVTLYDFGVDESGAFYYVMELLHGLDLLEMTKRFGLLPPNRLIFVLERVCRSLEEAHLNGLIHRDIKPANVFLCKVGPDFDWPKVLDFGIVKGRLEGDPDSQLTQMSGAGMIGTPGYIAPEAINHSAPVDHRFDIYSLGCVAYRVLTGREVFISKSAMQLMFAHVMEQPEPPSAVAPQPIPPELDQIILDCLKKNPEERPRSARELWQRLLDVPVEKSWDQECAEAWWREHIPSNNASLAVHGDEPTHLQDSAEET